MNRTVSVVDWLRRGRTERELLQHDPFLLIHAFAPGLFEDQDHALHATHLLAISARWILQSNERDSRKMARSEQLFVKSPYQQRQDL